MSAITLPPTPPTIADPENFATRADAFNLWLADTFVPELNTIIGTTIPAGSAAAGSLTGNTIAANVVNSSLTSVGTLTSLFVGGSNSGFSTTSSVFNSSNTASSGANIGASVAGSSAGDPYAYFGIQTGQYWTIGLDNSDSDAFVLSASAALGSSNVLRAATTGVTAILFAPTQVASSDANTLDDYEEGTWTPSDNSGAALSFTSPAGIYQKIGNKVNAQLTLVYPATADGTAASIAGLPFTCNGTAVDQQGWTTGGTETTARQLPPTQSATTLQILTGGAGAITNATMSGDTLRGMLIYRNSGG